MEEYSDEYNEDGDQTMGLFSDFPEVQEENTKYNLIGEMLF